MLFEITKQQINQETVDTVSARELHKFLENGDAFANWIKNRIEKYGFVENQDYVSFLENTKKPTGGRPSTDYHITLDMAKELSMVERNSKGREARQYFIECEKRLKEQTPLKHQLQLAIINAKTESELLTTLNRYEVEYIQPLEEFKAIAKPKAEYFDALVDRNLLTNFRDTAKELKVKQNEFISYLLTHGYVYRDTKGKLKPHAQFTPELFESKEFKRGGYSNIQTLITPKGRETFRLLLSPN